MDGGAGAPPNGVEAEGFGVVEEIQEKKGGI